MLSKQFDAEPLDSLLKWGYDMDLDGNSELGRD